MEDFWTKGLTPAQVKRAQAELGETPEVMRKSLITIKNLIEEEKGFKPLLDDEFLLRFLRAKKYDVKRAFNTLKNYYWYKAQYSGVLTDLTPKDVKHVLEMDAFIMSPKRGHGGEGVMTALSGKFDLESCTVDQQLAAVIIASEITIETDTSQVCGGSSLILDLKGMNWSRSRHYFNPSLVAKGIKGLQDCWPYRINGVHIIYEPYFLGAFYNLMKPLLSKKMRSRIHFHRDDLSSLHKFFPLSVLPTDLGGHLDEKDFLDFRKILLQNVSMCERLNRYTYQGVRHPKNSSSTQDCNDDLKSNETIRTLFHIPSDNVTEVSRA